MRQDPTQYDDPGTLEPYAGLARPPEGDIAEVARAALACRACHLYRHATQAVFGEGSNLADLMLVGEQPGDVEDREGRPFVGPAGRVLDEALQSAGIARENVYVTNAVKHFKWEPRGARRLHKKPNRAEMGACRPWLEAEIERIQPRVIVALGATAAQALLGSAFRVSQQRGQAVEAHERTVFATHHPSSLLRAPDAGARRRMMSELIQDLRLALESAVERRAAA
ncbi:MAG TPA: UdgX family uracil-DNA binding protein [Fimbriimonadaceae bacterium]|nr:UdgX family uracil-DNA binding protein [Fimbriimonadaceae bacterium]